MNSQHCGDACACQSRMPSLASCLSMSHSCYTDAEDSVSCLDVVLDDCSLLLY